MDVWEFRFCMNSNSLSFVLNITYWKFVRTGRIQGARLAGDRSILAYVRIPDQAGNAVDCRFSQTGIEIPASLLQQIQHQLKPIPPHIIRVRNIIKS